MRLEGVALSLTEIAPINLLLGEFWKSCLIVDKETFLTSTDGPDCIELLCGGELLLICDKKEGRPILFSGDQVYLGCGKLYEHLKGVVDGFKHR